MSAALHNLSELVAAAQRCDCTAHLSVDAKGNTTFSIGNRHLGAADFESYNEAMAWVTARNTASMLRDEEHQQWVEQVQIWLETRPADPCSGGPVDDLQNLLDLIEEVLEHTRAAYAGEGSVLPRGACAK